MEEEIHVVDSGTVPAADSSSMVLVTDENGKQQILHFSNNQQTSAEMLLEDLPAPLQEESMTVMQQETIESDHVDYCAHQRAAEVLQSMGEGITGQIEEVNAAHNQAVVYVEGCDEENERSITSDAIAAALQEAGATGNDNEQSQVIVLEGGSDGMVDMADVGEDFQGTLIVIMQQDEQQSNVMDTTDNLQEVHETSVFIDPKGEHMTEQNVAAFHSTQVFHQSDESVKENIECKDVSHEPVLEKPYHCKHCDKRFAWKRSLLVHERIHTGKDMFPCDQCGKSYSSKVSLQSHIVTHSKQEDKPFSCDICGKHFTKKWDWETHKWQHTGQKRFICEHCGKTYARNSDLRRHLLSHTGNKPFQCRYCGKGFITRWHFNYHERRHTGEKPYQCQLCWKEFMQKCHLDRHEITHASETYNCQYCGRKYIHKDELTRHERTHIKCPKETDVGPSDSTTVGNIESTGDDVGGNVDAALEYLMAFAQGHVGIDALKENGNKEIQESTDQETKCFGCKQSFADNAELQNHKENQPNCSADITSSAGSIHCKYCARTFKYKTSFIKHVNSHAAFHFDDEFEDLKLDIEERSKQISPMESSIFACIHCCRAYSAEEKLTEHLQVCTEKLGKNQREELTNDTFQIQESAEKTDTDYANEAATENDGMDCELDAGESISLHDTDGGSQSTDNLDYHETTKKNQRSQVKTILARDEGREVQIPLSSLIYVCRICNCEFKYKTSFERHEEQHEENTANIENKIKTKRPFICTLCGVGFRRPFHLTRHMETHSKRTQFKTAKKKKIKSVESPKAVIVTEKCEEIQEILDIIRDGSILNLSGELDNSAEIKYEHLNEDIQTEKENNTEIIAEPQNMKLKNIKAGRIQQDPKQMDNKLEISKKKTTNPSKNQAEYALSTTTTTRSRRSIRLPKRFRTDEDESAPEKDEEITKVKETSPRERTKRATAASTEKRGRPKKLIKETFECKVCEKTFPFRSLLIYHSNKKHKLPETDDNDTEDVDSTAAEEDEEITEVKETSPHERTKRATVVSTEKRGRPKKLIKETFECKVCEKTFPFRSLLIYHSNKKHKLPETDDNDTEDVDSTAAEEDEEITEVKETSPRGRAKRATVVTTKKRGRPKKLIKETFECKECEQTFPFRSLLKYHINSKHKLPETDDNDIEEEDSTATEEDEEITKFKETSPCERTKHATAASTKKRGRPKKLIKETFECKECEQTFPFRSLLRYHINAKHKLPETDDNDIEEEDSTATAKQRDCHDFDNSGFAMKTSKNESETILEKSDCNGSTADDNCESSVNDNVKTKTRSKNESTQDDQPLDSFKDLVTESKQAKEEAKTEGGNESEKSTELQTKGIRTRSKTNEFLCDQCGRKFASQIHVLSHQQSHIQTERRKMKSKTTSIEKQYNCGQCNQVLKTSTLLKRHKLLHLDKKGFKCITCGKTFRRSHDLKRHNLIHSGKKPFSCDICGKTFPYKFPLKVHLQSHTGARPYMCDVCGKMFAKKFDMEAHCNMHSGNTPHVCNICNKKYGRKADLDRHMTKHMGTQPLSCSLCDRKFSTRWHLRYHERTHTGEKPYTCDICNRKFAQLPHLNKHMMLHNKAKASTSHATSSENNIDKEFDGKTLLKSVVRGLQQVNEGEGSLGVLQDESQQIIEVLQVEDNNPDEMHVFNLILP